MSRNRSGDVSDVFTHSCKHLNSSDTSESAETIIFQVLAAQIPISNHDQADTWDMGEIKQIPEIWEIRPKNQLLPQCENRFGASGQALR